MTLEAMEQIGAPPDDEAVLWRASPEGRDVPHDAELIRHAVGEALRDGMTQKILAKQVGISPSAVSQWVHRDYRGNEVILLSKLRAWVNSRKAEKALPVVSGPPWVETPTARRIFDAMTFARVRPTISVIYGGAGVGKTTAMHQYADAYPNIFIVTAQPALASMMHMLREIAMVLSVHSSGWQRRSLVGDILNKLWMTRGLLVIDEAQHLGVQTLDQIRSIYDAAGIGLVLCGNESVYARLTGVSRRAEFAQIFSRVGRRVMIDMPKPEDVTEILLAWDVTGVKEREYAHQIASLPGGLRGLTNMLQEASMAAQGMDQPLDLRMMRRAWGELGASA